MHNQVTKCKSICYYSYLVIHISLIQTTVVHSCSNYFNPAETALDRDPACMQTAAALPRVMTDIQMQEQHTAHFYIGSLVHIQRDMHTSGSVITFSM